MIKKEIRMLLVEDDADYALGIGKRLSHQTAHTFHVDYARTLQEASDYLLKERTDIVLLDLLLPDSQGLETFFRISGQVPEIPIVILTVFGDEALSLEAVGKGAQDYLPKGEVDGKTVTRVIQYAIERHRIQSALRSLSLIDELTSLYNRRGFLRLADQHLKLAQRTNRGSLLVFADVDNLKQINDTFGHREGDQALIETADILKMTFRASDVIARIGGDEFAILAIEASQDGTQLLSKRLQDRLQERNAQQRRPYRLSVSIGLAGLDPRKKTSLEDLMGLADQALYEQKRHKPRGSS